MDFIEQFFVPATLEEAIDLAKVNLPEGYRIGIVVEPERCGFNLITPDGNEINVSSDECLRSMVIELLNLALEQTAAAL